VRLVGAHGDLVTRAAVDVVEKRARQPPPSRQPEVLDRDDHGVRILHRGGQIGGGRGAAEAASPSPPGPGAPGGGGGGPPARTAQVTGRVAWRLPCAWPGGPGGGGSPTVPIGPEP